MGNREFQTDTNQLIVSCKSSDEIVKTIAGILPLLSKEDRRLFNDLKHYFWSGFGIETLFEKFNDRSVASIINEYSGLVPQRVVARGRIDQVQFTLLRGPDETSDARSIDQVADCRPVFPQFNCEQAFRITTTKVGDIPVNSTDRSFYDLYAGILANVGIEQRFDDYTYKTLDELQQVNGIRLPQSLVEYYCLSSKELRSVYNRFRPIEEISIDEDKLIFLDENQQRMVWGVQASEEPSFDSEVFCGIPTPSGLAWRLEHSSCAEFVCLMTVWIGTFGGWFPTNSFGFVDEQDSNRLFATEWEFIAEVNGIRAFKKDGVVACCFHCEDLMQKLEGLASGRIHLAARNKEVLKSTMSRFDGRWRICDDNQWSWWN